jgi:hypothetical protein
LDEWERDKDRGDWSAGKVAASKKFRTERRKEKFAAEDAEKKNPRGSC